MTNNNNPEPTTKSGQHTFDAIAEASKIAMDCPSCLVSIRDNDTLFSIGASLPYGVTADRRMNSADTICKRTIESAAPVIIPDTKTESWLSEISNVERFNIGAYLGVPIRGDGNRVVGSMCVLSDGPRSWSDQDQLFMREMASLIELEIKSRILEIENRALASAVSDLDNILIMLAQSESSALSVHDSEGRVVFANKATQRISLPSDDEMRDLLTSLTWTTFPSQAALALLPSSIEVPVHKPEHLTMQIYRFRGELYLCDWGTQSSVAPAKLYSV
jgi:GAF domain-containing protein